MIKVEEIVDKYKGYEIDEKELEKVLVKPKPTSIWDLKDGDSYCYLESEGTITLGSWCENTVRNVFLTGKEAEFEIERRKIEAILLKYGRREFKNRDYNFYILYDHNGSLVTILNDTFCQYSNTIYFDTEELCQKAMIAAGEENIKKYIFGVKD